MHLTPNISYPLMIVVSALMLPVMIVRFYMGVWQMMFLDLPLIVASFWSISLFYVVAQRELYPEELEAIDLHAADADGGGRGADDHQYARRAGSAVRRGDQLRAHAEIRHRRAPDEAGEQEVPARAAAGCLTWRSRVGTYFLGMVVFAITTYNFLSIPFLALFVFGYYWAGFTTLYQEHQSRLRWLKARNLELARQA